MMNIHRITYRPETGSAFLCFIGCNFRCLCCYWKEIYGRVKFNALKFPRTDKIITLLKSVSPNSVTIVSGDPRPNPDFNNLPKLLKGELGCKVCLLTNGFILPNLEGITHVSMSIKAVDNELHKKYTGRSNDICIENFKKIRKAGIELSASSVYIPGLIEKEEIESIARFIADIDNQIPFRIIRYMKVTGFDYRRPDVDELKSLAQSASRYLKNVVYSRSSGKNHYTGIVDLFTNNLTDKNRKSKKKKYWQ